MHACKRKKRWLRKLIHGAKRVWIPIDPSERRQPPATPEAVADDESR